MTAVRVEDGVSLTSCVLSAPQKGDGFARGKRESPENSMWACDWRQDTLGEPLPSLLHRVIYNSKGDIRGAVLVLPRSWNIALVVLDALGNGRDPVDSVREMDVEVDGRPARDEESAATSTQQHDGIEGITWADLSANWKGVVQALEEDGVTVMNPDHALEGALSIREYEGSLVRHETYVFLDVTWLAKILKPLLNHREDEDRFFGSLSLGDTGITLDGQEDKASWRRFKETGVLGPELAGVLWPGSLCDYVLPTLGSLGLAHQLDDRLAGGLLVLLRLGKERPASVGKELDDFRRDHEAIISVTWKIFMGVPPGAVEKVLTRCCSTGELQTFWRFGVLVQGSMGGVTARKTFAMLVEYSHERSEINMKLYGNIATTAPWAALSLGISAVRVMCSEFPGLRWRASLKCPQHEQDMHISNTATRPGDKLLLEQGCTLCSSETGGVGAAATELLQMVDVLQSRGEMFREVHRRFVDLQPHYPVLRPETNSGGEEMLIRKMDGLTATVNGRFDETRDEVRAGFAQTIRKLDNMAKTLRDSSMCIKNLLAPNYPYPHLAVVKEVVTGGKRGFMRKLRGVAKKDMTLRFLCPVDMSEVPCGVGGEGYRFRETRGWVKKISPILQVTVVAARVALRATVGVDVEFSGFLQAVRDEVVEEVVDRTLDEEALFRVISGEGGAGVDMQRVTDSYEDLKKFMLKEESARHGDGYVDFREHMERVNDGKGGMVWVRTANVGKWQELLSNTAPSR
ncbi:unnamed protein product [Ectocarpus sp. 6 AP-2014]